MLVIDQQRIGTLRLLPMQTVLSRDHLQETLDKAEASAKKVCMVSDRRPAVVADSATENMSCEIFVRPQYGLLISL